MTLRITEVFFRAAETKQVQRVQQWFEIYNAGEEPVNLGKAMVRRVDGEREPEQIWAIELPGEDYVIDPGEYAVIAARGDLGQNLCSEHQVMVVQDPNFGFKPEGVQRLCVKTLKDPEVCKRISDSKATPKGRSNNFFKDDGDKKPEKAEKAECELKPGFLASPGLPNGFCKEGLESGWTECPEPVVEAKTEAQAAAAHQIAHQTARHASSGCQMVPVEVPGFMLVLLLIFCRHIYTRRMSNRIN